MCVIIGINENEDITKGELRKAWNKNPHGGGYCHTTYIENEHGEEEKAVHYKRGIMSYYKYEDEIMPLLGEVEWLILHTRITTSKIVNEVQCHPYDIYNLEKLEGITTNPVVCMNGTIRGQPLYKVRHFNKNGKVNKIVDYNDTMGFIMDHVDTFKIIEQSQEKTATDILNIIQDFTKCRWAYMDPNKTIFTTDFKLDDGKQYSNLRHKQTTKTYTNPYKRTYTTTYKSTKKATKKNNKKISKQSKKNRKNKSNKKAKK